jgi:peptidoglycan/xylan/chitin deacetylase (PgdA/CDA1 family)
MTAVAPNMNAMPARPRVLVTTSWDDDAVSGLRVAELLAARGLRGTFYTPTARLGQQAMFSSGDLRRLAAEEFEIGAHTVSHAILTRVSRQEVSREVGECKQTLQQILGREVTMFCYPKGRCNAEVEQAVKQAGYQGARGTRMLSTSADFLPFAVPTTVQAYPHTRANYVRNLVRAGALPALAKAAPDLIRFESWLQMGKMLFDRVLRDGGVWHLYGHPWEIEKLNLWSQLAEMLDYVGQRESVTYCTNGQLLKPVTQQLMAGQETESKRATA